MPAPTPVINRRYFLRAAGVTLALPLLESLTSRVLGASKGLGIKSGASIGSTRPTRMVCVGNMLGFYQPEFFPQKTGRRYDLPSLLQPLAPHQDDFTHRHRGSPRRRDAARTAAAHPYP